MEKLVQSDFKLGIISGGQLGKMLIQAAHNWNISTHVLDASSSSPGAQICDQFTEGSYTDYDTVVAFGNSVDLLTFEIEHVNIEALKTLKSQGKTIHPDPHVLEIIQDKGLQKDFYVHHEIPTAKYTKYTNKEAVLRAIDNKEIGFPFVQKSRKDGYDGKGVQLVKSASDLNDLFEAPSIIEDAINIEKEIAVIASMDKDGHIECFAPVEMEFNSTANMVEMLICPSSLSTDIIESAEALAASVLKAFNMQGVLAVEMFLTKDGQLMVNESAPRPHNSGHHTIESAMTSQYEQHLRSVLDMPLGSTDIKCPSVMINLLGQPDANGQAKYKGLTEAMQIPGVNLHIYGKKSVTPYRKMGHVTILDEDINLAKSKADKVKKLITVIS